MNTVAMIVSNAQKLTTQTAINALTPEYTIAFVRKVAPILPLPTSDTPPTHWYMNASAVPDAVVAAWLAAAPNLDGVILFTATNADNPLEWAYSNMASQGLMFVPNPET